MSLTNPPAIITALDAMLTLSTTWGTWAASTGRTWYPDVDIQNATFPCAALFASNRRRTKFADGAQGAPSGELIITVWAPVTTTIGTMETNAELVLDELLAQDTGIALRDGSVSAAADPTSSARAANDAAQDHTQGFRRISITLEYGLEP